MRSAKYIFARPLVFSTKKYSQTQNKFLDEHARVSHIGQLSALLNLSLLTIGKVGPSAYINFGGLRPGADVRPIARAFLPKADERTPALPRLPFLDRRSARVGAATGLEPKHQRPRLYFQAGN